MKKYWLLWLFLFVIGGVFFWAFLGEVEGKGKEYALLDILAAFLWCIFIILALILNAAYWGGIAKLVDKYFKNVSKYINYVVIAIYVFLGVWLECKMINGAKYLEKQYKVYMLQKEFEYKYHIKE